MIVKIPRSSCVENCSNNAKSQPNLNFYVLPSGKQWRRRWLQAIGRVQQRLKFLHSIFNFCMQRKCISAVLRQNPIKHASNIHANVFNSFYRTVTHGKTHGIIYEEILLSMRWSPHFSAFEPTSQQKSLQTSTCHFTILPLYSKISPEDTWTQSLISSTPTLLSKSQIITSKISHCLLQVKTIKS